MRERYDGANRSVRAQVRPVAADMDRLFAAADLVICRGGGTTVAELMAVGRASLVVPYPHHKDQQQLHNARVLERADAARVCEEWTCDVRALAASVAELLADPSELAAMGDRARALRRLDAAEVILADVRAEIERDGADRPRSGARGEHRAARAAGDAAGRAAGRAVDAARERQEGAL